MGIFDQAGDLAKQHHEKIEGGIDQAGNFIDEKTGGKYQGQVDQAQDFANDQLDRVTGQDVVPPVTDAAPAGDDSPAPTMQ